MEEIKLLLEGWSKSLPSQVSVGGLVSRCPIAHKWKAPFRCIVVREALLWRMHDLGEQILFLLEHDHVMGARILLRSAIETLAVLIYLNQKIEAVLAGSFSFFDFEGVTKQLLMGSKNEATAQVSVNILTVLERAGKSHKGLPEMHKYLSESAHPNYDGVLYGYSSTDPEKHETNFHNRCAEVFGEEQEAGTAFVLAVFEYEYNHVWTERMSQLEEWLRQNDQQLESQRAGR